MIDKNKIFGLFTNDNVKDEKKQKTFTLNMDDPYTKVGMCVKLIQNHYIFHQKLEKFLKQENPDYNIESTREASEFTVYNRAYSYLSKINPEDENHTKVILSFDPKLIKKSLNTLLNYFISTEEYERCAHIHKIQEKFTK
jgi:hypothetical protein|tara:strand:+ start:263 stop:682 length:420 start_codon:yes stop_codon:yes gene_type:complete